MRQCASRSGYSHLLAAVLMLSTARVGATMTARQATNLGNASIDRGREWEMPGRRVTAYTCSGANGWFTVLARMSSCHADACPGTKPDCKIMGDLTYLESCDFISPFFTHFFFSSSKSRIYEAVRSSRVHAR